MPELISFTQKGCSVPWWEKRLALLVTGHLWAFTLPSPDQEFEDDPKLTEGTRSQQGTENKKPYTFNKRETQIMRVCIDTMHMAGVALASQGFAIFLMGLAQLATMQSALALGTTMHGVNKGTTAFLLFRASAAFDNSFVGPGCNVSNLVKGIEGGLTDLFETMTSISWSVASAQIVGLFLPQLGKFHVGNVALMEVVTPRLTSVAIFLQNSLAG